MRRVESLNIALKSDFTSEETWAFTPKMGRNKREESNLRISTIAFWDKLLRIY